MSNRLGRASYCTVLSLLIAGSILVLATASHLAMNLWTSPSDPAGEATLHVSGGQTLGGVLGSLGGERDLPPARLLTRYASLSQTDRSIKQGRFKIPPDWSPAQTIEQLAIGANDPLRVVLPPGLSIRQTARRLEDSGWIESAESFVAAATGENARTLCGKETLEGLLGAETYFFNGRQEPEEVVRVLYRQWKSEIEIATGTSELSARMRNGLTLYDSIVLASLVEREAAGIVEMATVSSVFHNRIRKNWPMGASATLRYALDDWERGEHELPVNLDSPFNTNRRPGLPPHPICTPSRVAIDAALNPPDTPYFFFVADGEGKSVFNVTHEEHIRSARDYRKKMAERRASP